MKISLKFSILILFILSSIHTKKLQAQSLENNATELLKSEGFEEIRVLLKGNLVICTIERGRCRTRTEDFRRALLQLSRLFPDSCLLHILLLEQGQPRYQITVKKIITEKKLPIEINTNELQFKGEVSYFNERIWKEVKKKPAFRSVHTGLTLTIYPQITIRNIYLDQLYEKQFNLAPVLQYSGWRGMLLTGQLIFPLFNELGYEDNFIRPGFITISQNFVLPALNTLEFTAGNFNKNSYGFDIRWKKRFQHSSWSLGGNLGLTGTSFIYDRYWKHSPLDRFSWNVNAGYYLSSLQLQSDIQAGQFLAHDKGVRLDLYRHFGEVTVGVYAGYAGNRTNGGFHFAFPLDFFKRKHNSRFKIVLPESFDNEYNAMNEFVYGRYYETRPNENRSVQNLPPQFINNMFFHP